MTYIELRDVCFAYDEITALKHVNIELSRGECLALQGPNGCGKSTLLKLLSGLIFPMQGIFFFDGKEITANQMKDQLFAKKFHQTVGYVFQNAETQLFCGSVLEEIAFGPQQMGLSEDEVQKRCEDVLELLEIEHLKNRAPYHLSGGEKRKVAIACVLSMNPSVLLLDEPLAGLDPRSAAWLSDFLQELKEAGKTIILATHNDVLAQNLADRIYTF